MYFYEKCSVYEVNHEFVRRIMCSVFHTYQFLCNLPNGISYLIGDFYHLKYIPYCSMLNSALLFWIFKHVYLYSLMTFQIVFLNDLKIKKCLLFNKSCRLFQIAICGCRMVLNVTVRVQNRSSCMSFRKMHFMQNSEGGGGDCTFVLCSVHLHEQQKNLTSKA